MGRLIALTLPGGPGFVDELQRAWDAGDAVFPVDSRLPPGQQGSLIEKVGACAVIDETGEHRLDTGFPTETGDALVVATSGTMGNFKAAVLTHDALKASALLTGEALGIDNDAHWLACLPLNYIGGLSVITRSLIAGTKLTVLARFEAAVVNKLGIEGVTHVSLVNAAMKRIDTSLFRTVLLGGGPAPMDKPANVVATYGMTETGSGVVYDGYPLEGVDLRIDGDGIIALRSPTLFRCYRDASIPVDDQGWFRTGDVGELAADGKLTVNGRAGDVIVSGGEKIWPQAVEKILATADGVEGVLVHGETDDEWGQRVVATIEVSGTNRTPELQTLRKLVKNYLPAYCAPKELRVVESLDRTNSGKLIRKRGNQQRP